MKARVIAELPTYDDLVQFIDERRRALGYSMAQLDEVCGFPPGQSAKYLGPSQDRKFGWVTLFLMAPELGLRVAFIETDELLSKMRKPSHESSLQHARRGNHATQISMKVAARNARRLLEVARESRWADKSAEERSAHGSVMANARWKRRRTKPKRKGARVSRTSRGGARPSRARNRQPRAVDTGAATIQAHVPSRGRQA